MGRLAGPLSSLDAHYDAVVVGTGYGGGVAACRLARAGLNVAVLERGRELRPGDFPSGAIASALQTQLHRRGRRPIGRAGALFDFRASEDVITLVGCGVGGTSLINANVSLEPEPGVFEADLWPEPLRRPGGDDGLRAGFERARAMLRPTTYPEDRLAAPLPKLEALRVAARGAGTTAELLPVNVTFQDTHHSTGIHQPPCTGCGDCVTGCNVGAKNTVDQTYVADAVANGASLVTEASVTHVERAGDRWRVHVLATGSAEPTVTVEAGIVVLGAGSLGSTEILLRSRREGLWVSDTLGTSVSGNGDFLGYAYDAPTRVHGVGQGARVRRDDPVGPCITGGFTVDADTGDEVLPVLFEEGSLPKPMSRLAPLGFWLLSRKNPDPQPRDRERARRRLRSLVEGAYRGPVSRTMVFLGMGYDGDRGEIDVPDDPRRRGVIHWPNAGRSREQQATQRAAAAMGEHMDATYLPSPVAGKFVTVHPLGGCAMADDGAHGVVDHAGRVFAGTGGEVHDGLLVVDGAIVPVPLGKNPSFTIAALAERAMARLIEERGLQESTDPAPRLAGTRTGVTFRERMTGSCDPLAAGTAGAALDLRLVIAFADLAALEADPTAPGSVRGTVHVGLDGLGTMPVETGTLVLFRPSTDAVDQADMVYDLRCRGEDGNRYRVHGIKRMHDHPGFDMWRDTTNLDVTVSRTGPEGAVGEVVATGKASLGVTALLGMMASMRTTGDRPGPIARVVVTTRFGWRFLRGLLGTYGKVLRQRTQFESVDDQPPRRPLQVPPSTTHWCRQDLVWTETDPGAAAMLKLQRFQGGTKGPVLLATGFAMAASQFLVDTIEPNLVEQLVAAGYDVWLFDYRAGIDMPTARSSFTVDDVALVDWPAAVKRVRDVSGADSVQVIAHCVGSMSLQMALLGGMEGVRSAVTSQVTVHPRMHWSMRVKTRLRVPRLLEGMGIRTVEPQTDLTLGDRMLDVLVRANPLLRGERCNNLVCRWVFFFFGPTHVHDQLDPRTHQRIAELFGVASLDALDHIALCVNEGHAVDHDGDDTYLPHIERFRIPITFLVGERNRIFYPASTESTLEWLRENTPPAQFEELYRELRYPDYAHLDHFIGKDAPTEVFPRLVAELDRFN